MSDRVVTREQAAKSLNCSMRTIERMLRDGRLGSVRREDGRLSVDADDLALVVGNPDLLEERRTTLSRERPAASAGTGSGNVALADPPVQSRLTTLDGPRHPVLTRPELRTDHQIRNLRKLVGCACVITAAAAIAFLGARLIGSHDARPSAHVPATRATHPSQITVASGGHVHPGRTATEASIRGGRSNTVATRATRPQARRPPLSQPVPPATGHARAGAPPVVINCGFGSLTMAAC
jgi:excisionase family DNA binding protein